MTFWTVATLELAGKIRTDLSKVSGVTGGRGSDRILVWGSRGLRVYDRLSSALIWSHNSPAQIERAVMASNGGRVLAQESKFTVAREVKKNRFTVVWLVPEGRELIRKHTPDGSAMSPNGDLIVVVQFSGPSSVLLVDTQKEIAQVSVGCELVYAFTPPSFSEKGNRIVVPGDSVSSGSGCATVWEYSSGPEYLLRKVSLLSSSQFGFGDSVLSPNGKLIVTMPGELSELGPRVWSADTGQEISRLPPPDTGADGISPSFSGDGAFIAGVSGPREISILVSTTGDLVASLSTAGEPKIIKISPDARTVLYATRDGEAYLWRIGWGTADTPSLKKAACKRLTQENAVTFSVDEFATDPLLRELFADQKGTRVC